MAVHDLADGADDFLKYLGRSGRGVFDPSPDRVPPLHAGHGVARVPTHQHAGLPTHSVVTPTLIAHTRRGKNARDGDRGVQVAAIPPIVPDNGRSVAKSSRSG